MFCGSCGYYSGINDGLIYVVGAGLDAAFATLSAAACFESLIKGATWLNKLCKC